MLVGGSILTCLTHACGPRSSAGRCSTGSSAPTSCSASSCSSGPLSYYFSTLYTEALFILLTVAGFVLLRQRDYVAAGVTGALMSATRSTGLLFAAAILIARVPEPSAATAAPSGSSSARSGSAPTCCWRWRWCRSASAVFAVYLWFHSGDALAFVHIQRAWGRAFQDPFNNLWPTLTVQFQTYHNYSTISTDLAFGLAAIVGIALSAVMAWKGRWDWAIFSLFGVLLPLSTNTYSMIRFVVGLAPVLITALAAAQPLEMAVLSAAAGHADRSTCCCCRSGPAAAIT